MTHPLDTPWPSREEILRHRKECRDRLVEITAMLDELDEDNEFSSELRTALNRERCDLFEELGFYPEVT